MFDKIFKYKVTDVPNEEGKQRLELTDVPFSFEGRTEDWFPKNFIQRIKMARRMRKSYYDHKRFLKQTVENLDKEWAQSLVDKLNSDLDSLKDALSQKDEEKIRKYFKTVIAQLVGKESLIVEDLPNGGWQCCRVFELDYYKYQIHGLSEDEQSEVTRIIKNDCSK